MRRKALKEPSASHSIFQRLTTLPPEIFFISKKPVDYLLYSQSYN